MHDRSALGSADVSDAALTEMVARLLGCAASEVTVVESSAEVAAYDLEALTTAGRYWVRGRAHTPAGDRAFSFFVKVVQSWARTPYFAFVPPEMRAKALLTLPWESEPAIYRSDLADRLPAGLSMPTAYAVIDLDDESAALWLEEIDHNPEPWTIDRYRQAARLLGRLAASAQVRPTTRLVRGGAPNIVRGYAEGRVAQQLVPALRSDDVWSHPLIAAAYDERLRAEITAAADDLGSIVDELEAMPTGTLHGDACTRNLLVDRTSDDLALIDYGFWGDGPLGFDLGQLLIGEVQTGERPAASLAELEEVCLPAYVEGLRAEGCDVPLEVVRRAHALQLLMFCGLSSLPLEQLGADPTPELQRVVKERAESLRFILDLVASTARVSAA